MSQSHNEAKLIEVPTEQMAANNGAFVAIYCRDVRPYLNYDRPIACAKDQKFPYVLMQLRWDGVFGFPGGKVDPGETLRQACVREAREEIGVSIKEEDLVPVCSHMREGGNFAAHLYAVEVDVDGLHAAIKSSWTAQDADAEVCGVIAPRVSLFGSASGKGIVRFIRQTPMSFSARLELVLVLERMQLLDPADLQMLRTALAGS